MQKGDWLSKSSCILQHWIALAHEMWQINWLLHFSLYKTFATCSKELQFELLLMNLSRRYINVLICNLYTGVSKAQLAPFKVDQFTPPGQ